LAIGLLDPLVPFQTQPQQVSFDSFNGVMDGAVSVGIIVTQYECATLGFSE
jgi:hypothetical protein